MADPVRKQIRDTVGALLIAGATAAGANVFTSRHKPINETDHLPALRVLMADEENEIQTMGSPRRLEHRADLVVQCLARGADTLDDTLDGLAAEVVAILGGNLLGGLLKDIEPGKLEMEFDGDGNKPHGAEILTFYITYHTAEDDLTAVI